MSRWKFFWFWLELAGSIASSLAVSTAADREFVVPQRLVIPQEFQKPKTLEPEKTRPERFQLVVPMSAKAPDACPLDASVIIRTVGKDQHGREITTIGSGTIVLSESGVSTVLTCAHNFRGISGASIAVTHEKKVYPAKLLRSDEPNDLAVLSVNADLPAVGLADVKPGIDATVTSVGLSGQSDDGLEEKTHRITAVDKYDNPRNFESDGRQLVGRSGGGLFFNGKLCGVIQGRRNDIVRSLYVSIEPIRECLGRALTPCESCAVEQFGAGSRRRLVTAYSLKSCQNCKRDKDAFHDGNLNVKIDWTDDDIPKWIQKKLPHGYEAPVYVWKTDETHYQWPKSSDGITLELLEKWTEESDALREESAFSAEPQEVGASIKGKELVRETLSFFLSTLGDGATAKLLLKRKGGLDALPIDKKCSRTDVLGTSGRIELSVVTSKGLPIHEIKFNYRFAKGKVYLTIDELEVDIPEEGVYGSAQPVGCPILVAYEILSIAYDIWQIFHPTVDVWLGETISLSAVFKKGELSVECLDPQPAVRAHWSFMMGLMKVEYQRPLTGVLLNEENAVVQFHKSRVYRDVNLPVQ